MAGIEVRKGTAEEIEAANREVAGLPARPLIRVTFYGHMVHNPDQVGTLTPAIAGHSVDITKDVQWPVAAAMLPMLFEHLLGQIFPEETPTEESER